MISFCIFEDSAYSTLYPITQTSPIYAIRVGTSTLFEKALRFFNHGTLTLHCRPELKPLLKEAYPGLSINNCNAGSPCLFLNGRVILNDDLAKQINTIDENTNTLLTYHNTVIAAYLKGDALQDMIALLQGDPPNNEALITHIRPYCTCLELNTCDLITAPWDLLTLNSPYIKADFQHHGQAGIIKGNLQPYTAIYNENNVYIDTQCTIEDFVVINAQKGPVIIESGVYIHAHTRLEGPLFIGKNSQILGGLIARSSIGRHCKVAGELSDTILSDYSNKAHAGFVGHSFIGKWVNLGAHTTTSNLKNTYGTITMSLNGKKIETNQQFLGSIIGDHVKTAIGTLFNTGTIVSFGATVFNHESTTKSYPPFCWGPPTDNTMATFEKWLQYQSRMMARRSLELSQDYAAYLKQLYTTVS